MTNADMWPVMRNNGGRKFADVTPAEVRSLGECGAYAICGDGESLLLGVVSYDEKVRKDHQRLLRFEGIDGEWCSLYNDSILCLDERTGAGRSGASAPRRPSVSFRIDDTAQPSRVLVRFDSPASCRILAARDGRAFEPIEDPGAWLSAQFDICEEVRFCESVVALFDVKGQRSLRFRSGERGQGEWRFVPEPPDDGRGPRIPSGLAALGPFLFVAYDRPGRGFEIWRSEGDSPGSLTWHALVERGAHRFVLNEAVYGLHSWKGAVYVATGGRMAGSPARFNVSSGFELIRIYPDGDWDLIIGQPRFTPKGLKVPLSALGPGLDDFAPLEFQSFDVVGDRLHLAVHGDGGLKILTTENGESWEPVDTTDFAEYRTTRVRHALACEAGTVLDVEITDVYGATTPQIRIATSTAAAIREGDLEEEERPRA